MVTSDKGVEFIKRKEGLKLKAYQDIVGKWTIGYGHLIKLPMESYFLDVPTTDAMATALLRQDLKYAEKCVAKCVTVVVDQCQFDALVSFVYNLGCGALERSTLLKLLNEGNYSRAAEQFLVWNKAGGKEVRGLTIRRQEEKDIFLNGDYNESA